MGHVGRLKDEYRDLLHRLEAGPVSLPEPEAEQARRAHQELLELIFTPEQAALAARLPVRPASLETIAARVKLPLGVARERLDALCDRGLVVDLVSPETGATSYVLSPPVVGFFEFTQMRAHDTLPQKQIAEALHAYVDGDPAFLREVFTHGTVFGRALPHEAALGADELPEVLDWERATTVIRDARALAVSLCFCRHAAEHRGTACQTPQENCLSLNAGAEFIIRSRFGRAIDAQEALDILADARARSLVQLADNVQRQPSYICNCCGCCCEQLRAISVHGLPAVNPSGFEARSDASRCVGCSRCARACPIGAIEMKPAARQSRPRAELRPAVDLDRCIGCGVCGSACHKRAMALVPRAVRPKVPSDSVEKALLFAIDRGRLAHLVFDEGASRGSRVLNRILAALLALPPAKQILANQQLRSRFVRFALGQVADPTK